MDLDLGSHHVSSVDIVCAPRLSEDEFARVQAALPKEAVIRGTIVRHSDYKVGRRQYHEFASLGQTPDGHLLLSVGVFPAGGELTRRGRVSDLLEALAPLERTARADCVVQFTYPSRRWSSIVRLPVRLSEWGQPFDEIRGVRLVKVSRGKELEYSAIVDRAESRDYSLSLSFAYESPMDASMVERVILEAGRIASLFIKPRSET